MIQNGCMFIREFTSRADCSNSTSYFISINATLKLSVLSRPFGIEILWVWMKLFWKIHHFSRLSCYCCGTIYHARCSKFTDSSARILTFISQFCVDWALAAAAVCRFSIFGAQIFGNKFLDSFPVIFSQAHSTINWNDSRKCNDCAFLIYFGFCTVLAYCANSIWKAEVVKDESSSCFVFVPHLAPPKELWERKKGDQQSVENDND